MNDRIKLEILDIKEKIQDLTEYLQSDICKGCGAAALQVDKYIKRLSELIRIDNN